MKAGEGARAGSPPGVLAFAGFAAALAATHAFSVFRFGAARLGGVRYFLADDDVLISMRYARNLARGVGLVLNPGERVEGFTNPLLTFIGALLHLLGVAPSHLPLALDIVNLAASVAILWLLWTFWRTPGDDTARGDARADERKAGWVGAALYLLAAQHLFYAHAGYEVYLQAVILLYGVSRFDRIGPGGALALGLLPLAHATSVPSLLMLVLAMLVFHAGPLRRRFALAALALLLPVAYEVFRVAYYGDWVPNTFWLKVGAGRLSGGIIYARAWLRLVLPAALLGAPVVIGGAIALRRSGVRAFTGEPANRKLLVATAVLVAHLGEVISVGGDYFPLNRFLFPCTVLVAALGGRGAVSIARWAGRLSAATSRRAATAGLAALGLAAVAWPILNLRMNGELVRGRADWDIHHLALGLAIRDNTPPDSWVAVFALGYAAYFGDRPAIDMLGKADRHIARRPANPRRAIAHNKTDFDYVLSRRPDLVELSLPPPETGNLAALTALSATSAHGYQAELALNPVFQQDFAAHPVLDERGRPIRLYARAGGALAGHATGWRVDEAYFATAASR